MARCLYIAWTDGTYGQFTVPDDYHLQVDHAGNLLPEKFTIYGDPLRTELWLNTRLVKNAMVIDIGADRPVTLPAALLG
jgi:hypothetical protein